MNKAFKLITASFLSLTLSTAVLTPVTVLADDYNSSVSVFSNEPVTKDGYRVFLIDGKMVKWPADKPAPTEAQIKALKQDRGKWGAAIKAIRKGYNKVPANIRGYINKYLGLNAILGTLDHWTGWIEDGIYTACKKAGMPDWMARAVAKSLTMIAL